MADDVPSTSTAAAAASGGGVGHRFLWLSDVHLDPYYGTPLAFRESYDDGANCDASDDDSTATSSKITGRYGCDSPPSLVLGAIDAALRGLRGGGEEEGGDPSFVLVTGDVVRHGIDQLFVTGNFEEGSESRVDNNNSSSSSSAMDGAAYASYHDIAMIEAGKVMGTASSYLRDAFPNATIVICLGNNDVVPDYYLELYEDDENDGNGNEGRGMMPTPQTAGMLGVLYDALVGDIDEDGMSSSILTSEDMSTFLRGGYYHRTFHDGSLIVLSLNTVLYSSFHGPTIHRNIDDPGGQFEWMRTTLRDCRRRRRTSSSTSAASSSASAAAADAENGTGCSAMIVGHVPPAMGSYRHQQLWKEGYIRTYYEIVKEYDDVVTGQLFGHLHSDEFRVGIADDDDDDDDDDGGIGTDDVASIPDLSMPLLLGSSVTPLHGNDPSFRIVRYDRGMRRRRRGGDDGTTSGDDDDDDEEVGYRIVDYDSYAYSAIGGGDANDGDGGGWSRLYTFSEAYGDVASDVIEGEGLSSGTFRAIVGAMEDGRWGGESPTLRAYRSYKLSGARKEENQFGAAGTCDSSCRDDYICIFRSATTAGYERCIYERGTVRHRVIGGEAPGIVAGVLFAVIIVVVAFVKCHRMKKVRREHYDFAPSVHEEVRDDDMDVRDREMI